MFYAEYRIVAGLISPVNGQLTLTGDCTSFRLLFAFFEVNECNGDFSTTDPSRLVTELCPPRIRERDVNRASLFANPALSIPVHDFVEL
jgi:hypothetical protein